MDDQNHEKLINRFENRAKFRERQAYVVLFTIFLLLGVGVLIFIYAPTIVQSDLLAKHKSQIKEFEYQIKIIDERIALFKLKMDELFDRWKTKNRIIISKHTLYEGDNNYQASDYITFTSRELMEAPRQEYIDKINKTQVGEAIGFRKDYSARNNDILSVEYFVFNGKKSKYDYLNELKKENAFPSDYIDKDLLNQAGKDVELRHSILQKISQLREELVLVKNGKKAEAGKSGDGNNRFYLNMIQTNVTRFGTLLLIIFLVGILIPLYRYNIRLSSYYHARADVILLLSNGVTEKIDILAAILTPNYDFGKIPNNMLEQTIELAKEMAKTMKGK